MDFDSLEEAEVVGGTGEDQGAQNVALRCPASASSVKGPGREAENAVDGDPSTRWTSAYEDNQWLVVDLREVHELELISVRWEAAFASIYLLQGSLDNVCWVTFASAAGRDGCVETPMQAGSFARWVRVFGQRRATEYGFSIWELEVLGVPRRAPVAVEMRLRHHSSRPRLDDPRLTNLDVDVLGGISGETLCTLRVDASNPALCARDIKRLVGDREGTPACEQKLVCDGRLLHDAESIGAIALEATPQAEKGARPRLVLMMLRLPPGRAALLRDVEQGATNIWFLPADLQEEPDFVIGAVRRNVLALKFAAPGARDNRDLMLALVREQSEALRFASERLRDDPEVVLAAVERDASAVRHASRALRGSAAVLLAAMEQRRSVLRFAEPGLLSDTTFREAAERTGVFRDTEFEYLLQITPDSAWDMEQRGVALFLDARDESEYHASHVTGALHKSAMAKFHETPELQRGFREKEHSVVIYSDNGLDVSRCLYYARNLRQNPNIQACRVLRLTGGLNAWKQAGFPVDGDTRLMVKGQVVHRGEQIGLFQAPVLSPML